MQPFTYTDPQMIWYGKLLTWLRVEDSRLTTYLRSTDVECSSPEGVEVPQLAEQDLQHRKPCYPPAECGGAPLVVMLRRSLQGVGIACRVLDSLEETAPSGPCLWSSALCCRGGLL